MKLCETLFIFCVIYGMTQGFLQLVQVVPSEHDRMYRCVSVPEMENAEYSWRRYGMSELPRGVKAVGDRLYLEKFTDDINGLYICEVTNEKSAAAGSLYLHFKANHSEL